MFHIEVCIDNLESLPLAIAGGATRIELCSSLALGGLTPSFGFMQCAAKLSSVPVYAMIRPRQGDFLYQQNDLNAMLLDIDAAASAGLQGIVFGVLDRDGHIDLDQAHQLAERAQLHGLGMTFHRAIDQCRDVHRALEDIIALGCERVLTSGQAADALSGVQVLHQMVAQAGERIAIMAGAGLNAGNVREIVTLSGVRQVHLSGKSQRPSHMQLVADRARMGDTGTDDFVVPVTNPQAIDKVAKALKF